MAYKLTPNSSNVVTLSAANVENYAIIPKQFFHMVKRTGFGLNLFYDCRYIDAEGQIDKPNFVMNKHEFRAAS
ncbi:3-isopropylmalate dehydratase small subunit, partial [Erwinia amylovora]|nr:3-isopropylmalate dehydratase small subunit [Erwinia amylovora]